MFPSQSLSPSLSLTHSIPRIFTPTYIYVILIVKLKRIDWLLQNQENERTKVSECDRIESEINE